MIVYLATEQHQYTIYAFLRTLGREIAASIRPVSYEELFRSKSLPVATYIFSDLERLSPEQSERASTIWAALAASGCKLLNNPVGSMRRFELLRELSRRGINDFDVYRLTEARQPTRFPVFIRGENDHLGSITPLLYSPEQLKLAVESLKRVGKSREDKLAVEFTDVRNTDGVYHKYGAFAVGDTIVAAHLDFSRNWVAKGASAEVDNKTFLEDEFRYVIENPHEHLLRPIFQLACIDYGRIDYAVIDGQLRVFEINSNPDLDFFTGVRMPATQHWAESFVAALRELDRKCESTGRVAVPFDRELRERLRQRRRIRALRATLRCLGLSRYSWQLICGLRHLASQSTSLAWRSTHLVSPHQHCRRLHKEPGS